MSKEQLEQMEHDYKNAFPIDIDWLIAYAKEQTERVEEYEYRYNKHLDLDIMNDHKIRQLEQQNKEYRSYLELIKFIGVNDNDVETDEVIIHDIVRLSEEALKEVDG